jgi:D-glycero-D-manno-heptose 1,7-bisphosphate phosphatase
MLAWFNTPEANFSRFLLLDRDGILNKNSPDYVKSLDEVVFYPDALEALALLHNKRIGVILISNQSGINRGIITWDNFWAMHEGVVRRVEECGGNLLAAFYCPHRPDENCECRKPAPGMILAARRYFGFLPGETCFIGDSGSDIEAAANAGCTGIPVCRDDSNTCQPGKPLFRNLLYAVKSIFGSGP